MAISITSSSKSASNAVILLIFFYLQIQVNCIKSTSSSSTFQRYSPALFINFSSHSNINSNSNKQKQKYHHQTTATSTARTRTTLNMNTNKNLKTSNRIQSTLDPCVVLMKQLITKHSHLWDTKEKGGIYSLAQGVVYWEPPPCTYDALNDVIQAAVSSSASSSNDKKASQASEISNDLHQYCPDEGLPSLIHKIKLKLKRENHLPSESNTNTSSDDSDDIDDNDTQVIVTSGANQAYMNCILALLSEKNDTSDDDSIPCCVVFKPYYFNHVMAVQMTRGEEALLVGPIDEYGMPCVDWLRQALIDSTSTSTSTSKQTSTSTSTSTSGKTKKIQMVTITNPGNPTGVSLPRNKLQQIVDLCKEYGVWLVMDNTYEHFDHEQVNCFPIQVEQTKSSRTKEEEEEEEEEEDFGFHCFQDEHVINIFSFSKGYAMAGFRVGYVVVNASGEKGKDAYQQMLKVQDTIPICTSRLSQLAAQGALSAGRKWVTDKVRTLGQSRKAILDALTPLETTIGGSGAMYVMGKLPTGMEDDMVVGELLVEKYGIAIIPGSFCGYPGWIRVCYSNLNPEDCLIAADRLAKGIAFICK